MFVHMNCVLRGAVSVGWYNSLPRREGQVRSILKDLITQ